MRRLMIYGVLLALALGAIAVGVDLVVETDEERIERVLDELRAAAAAGDAEHLVPLLDLDGDGFEIALGRERERFAAGDLELLEERLAEGVEWLDGAAVRFERMAVTVAGSRAHAYGRLVIDRARGADDAFTVDVALRRDGETWRVTRFRAQGGSRLARTARR